MPVGRPWPVTLPQEFSQQGFQKEQTPVRIETETDAGFVRRRRRFTQPTRTYPGTMLLDDTQVDTFYTFYDTTTNGGSLDWDWKDPLTEQAAVVAFVGEEPTVVSEGAAFRASFSVRVISLE